MRASSRAQAIEARRRGAAGSAGSGPGAIVGLDAHGGVQREPAAMAPAGAIGGGLGHVPRDAGRAHPAALAGVRDQEVVAAVATAGAGETAGQDPALEISAQLALDVARNRGSVGIAFAPACQPGLGVLRYEPVERRVFGTTSAMGPRRTGTGYGKEV